MPLATLDGAVPAFMAAAWADPAFFEALTPEERAVVPYMHDLWLRPEQIIPRHDWRSFGHICGRGWGKSMSIACEINRRVMAGESRALALMAPTEPRADEVQVAFLIATAPPWFRPERWRGMLRWPNGVVAEVFTPEAPGRSRSGNYDLSWMCEIVDWQPTTRLEAYQNLATATRVGRAQILWDTTSKGRNEVITALEEQHAADPVAHPIRRGSTFENPLLSRKYLADTCAAYTGRRFREEILGEVMGETAGALWQQSWLDLHRVTVPPSDLEVLIVGVDPGLSAHRTADATGLVLGGRGRNGDVYLLEDWSERLRPEQWGDVVVEACVRRGAAGCTVERNHLGDNAIFVIRSRATSAGLEVRTVARDRPFPSRTPGVLYVRETVSRSDKASRAEGPASETEAGRVHIVGRLDDLELELTTWEPGGSRSPNRLDAAAAVITELRGLGVGAAPDRRRAVVDAAAASRALGGLLARIPQRSVGL